MKSLYRRIPEEKHEQQSQEHEIRVRKDGRMQPYIIRAAELLLNKKLNTVSIQVVDRAIPLGLILAEIIRKRIKGLYQINNLKSLNIKESWEPISKESGLNVVTKERHLPYLEIIITRTVTEEQKQLPGFMDLLPQNELEELDYA